MQGQDVPALLVRAAAQRLRDPDAIALHAEEWLANLPPRSRSRYKRWRYAISLLTRGAGGTRAALGRNPHGGTAAGTRFSVKVVLLAIAALYGGLAWCVNRGALWAWPDQPPPACYLIAELAMRCALVVAAGALSFRRPLVWRAFITALCAGPAAELALAPVFSFLAPEAGTTLANHPVLANVSDGMTAVFVAVGVALAFDRSLERGQRVGAVIYMVLLVAVYEVCFEVSWCKWLVYHRWWPGWWLATRRWLLASNARDGQIGQIIEGVINPLSVALALLVFAAALVVVTKALRVVGSIVQAAADGRAEGA